MSLLSLYSCQSSQQQDPQTLFLSKDSTHTSIGFVNKLPEVGSLSIVSYPNYFNGAGVAAGDVNNDGFTDLFFVSNKGRNKLYLNKGHVNGFQFEDISSIAGVEGAADWQTGVSMADVNGDGWLDIYICAVSQGLGLEGVNELYINQGPNADGVVTFREQAAEWGLDFKGFSTQAAFFDYDRDGDLDMFLLNNAVRIQLNYGRVASSRKQIDDKIGDFLFENQLVQQGVKNSGSAIMKFKDVTKQAGIFQAPMGYGLGVAVADLNNDGWDDIYVANDFHEDDYYYLNQGDGTFKESVREYFGHVSRFSMGCDAADINNDGYPDLMTLDMFPQDEVVEKSSMGEENYVVMNHKLSYGYLPQYSRNCLQISLAGEKFMDVGAMAGVAATDWSWSTLLADFDNDGQKDIFVANGIARRQNDLDFVKYLANAHQYMEAGAKNLDQEAVAMMPEGRVHNYFFRGTNSLKFEDRSADWGMGEPSLSSGAVYVDLDNDGDLDLVTNNMNEAAGIFENRSEKFFSNHYLKVKLKGADANTFGIGAKVYLKHKGELQFQQLMPVRGFLSSVDPQLNFGLGKHRQVDSLIVIWGNGKAELKTGLAANTTVVLEQAHATEEGSLYRDHLFAKPASFLEEVTDAHSLSYQHQENFFVDFAREPLTPFMLSTEGPKLAVGDVNGDGLEDFYAAGAKQQAAQLFMQQSSGQFKSASVQAFEADAIHEDVDAAFFDADGDGDLDLYVVSGGNETHGQVALLLDRLYFNDGKGNFSRTTDHLPLLYANKSCVRPFDYDGDGDMDLFVAGRSIAYEYGHIPDSYLLINDGTGKYTDQTEALAPSLRKAGMLADAVWTDFDGDGRKDLLVVGDWMPLKLFRNDGKKLVEVKNTEGLAQNNGFWQAIKAADFDGDGDEDFILGNLGTNSKLKKEEQAALRLYVKDIDQNSTLDPVLAYQLKGKWYIQASKDELDKQLPIVHKKFTDHKSFAGKSLEEVFDQGELEEAQKMEVNQLSSLYLENLGGGRFKQHELPQAAQVSKIFAFHIEDVDQDGHLDVLLGGNLYGVNSYQGRYDASYGLMLKGNGKGSFEAVQPTTAGFLLKGEVRDIKPVKTAHGELLLVARNNLPLQVFKVKKEARQVQ